MIARRPFTSGVAVALALPHGVRAQRPNKLPRVALVLNTVPLAEMAGADPSDPMSRSFMRGLREQGLIEGRDIVVERRSAEGRPEQLPALMQELVGLGVDVIVTLGPAIDVARQATGKIAIVALAHDPLGTGLVANLGRPGGNVTGIGIHSYEVLGKQLQLLKEAVPQVSRVAVIDYRRSFSVATRRRLEHLQAAAAALRLELVWLGADTQQELDDVLATIERERPDGIYVQSTAVTYPQRQRIADWARQHRLPSVGFAEQGMLLSYDAADEDLRRAAVYVRKILGGARPADLPFEQPTRFKLIVNLRTAKALGLTIPRSLLLRADEVIE